MHVYSTLDTVRMYKAAAYKLIGICNGIYFILEPSNKENQTVDPFVLDPNVEQDIELSMRKLEKKFSGVQRRLLRDLRASNTPIEDLQDFVVTSSSFVTKDGEAATSPLFETTRLPIFMQELKPYSNALNPSLLEDITDEFGDQQTQEGMKQFKEELASFRRGTKLKDFIGTYKTTNSPEFKELEVIFKDSWKERTLEDLEHFRHHLSRKSLVLKMVRVGSIIVVFLMPTKMPISLEKFGDYLRSQGVLQVKVDGIILYKIQVS